MINFAFLTIILTIMFTTSQTTITRTFSGNKNHHDLNLIYEKSLQTEAGKILNTSSVAGDIEISTWDKNEVSVKIYGNSEAELKLVFDAGNTYDGVKVDC